MLNSINFINQTNCDWTKDWICKFPYNSCIQTSYEWLNRWWNITNIIVNEKINASSLTTKLWNFVANNYEMIIGGTVILGLGMAGGVLLNKYQNPNNIENCKEQVPLVKDPNSQLVLVKRSATINKAGLHSFLREISSAKVVKINPPIAPLLIPANPFKNDEVDNVRQWNDITKDVIKGTFMANFNSCDSSNKSQRTKPKCLYTSF